MLKGDGIYLYDDAGTVKIKKIGSQVGGKSTYGKGYYNQLAMIDTDKFVVAYRDLDLGSHGCVRVGQINGDNTITWGTVFQFYLASVFYLDICKLDTDKFAVSFRDGAAHCQARIGTVSGTTISMGATYPVNAASTSYISNCQVATNKFVTCYTDGGNFNYGTARVGVVTGTIIAFGAEYHHRTATTYYNNCYGTGVDNKFMVVYRGTAGNSKIGEIGGAGGNEITFGSEYNWKGDTSFYNPYVKNVDSNEKMMIIFRNTGAGSRGYTIVGTVSGTVISWGTEQEFNNVFTYYYGFTKLADDKALIIYSNDSGDLTGSVKRLGITGTAISFENEEELICDRMYYPDAVNVTDTKYVIVFYDTVSGGALSYGLVVDGELNTVPFFTGILKKSGSEGDMRAIDLIGTVTEALTGLTPTATYWWDTNGELTTTTCTYGAGKALSETELLIKAEGYL